MYRLNPGKYGYENPSKKTSLIAPSPAKTAPPTSVTRLAAIANQSFPITILATQNTRKAARNAAIAPAIVNAQGVPIPRTRAGIAIVYGAANCIEKRDSGCG